MRDETYEIMKKYIFTIKHDTGTTKLEITAKSKKSALQQFCTMEQAPERAILDIKRIETL